MKLRGLLFCGLISGLLISCDNRPPKQKMVDTSLAIIKALNERDTITLKKLFVSNESTKERDIRFRNEHIAEGMQLCSTPYKPDTSKIRIDKLPVAKTIYIAYVEIPFINISTGEIRGKITCGFANFCGFTQATELKVFNSDHNDSIISASQSRQKDSMILNAGREIIENNIPVH